MLSNGSFILYKALIQIAIVELMSACPFILPSVPETSLIHHIIEYILVE